MRPETIRNKTILLSALNWGMGHVSRCISLIEQLQNQENTVIIACSDNQSVIFKSYFPTIQTIHHEDYPFTFKGKGNFEKDLLSIYYKLFIRFKKEKSEVEQLFVDFNIDLVLSDHRYGFVTEKCPSIFITHQLNLPVKWYAKWIDYFHKSLIQKFNFVWVLDTPTSKFADELSRNFSVKNVEYIGIHSRFSLYPSTQKSIEKVVIISGPEPYAQQFFEEQLKIAASQNEKTIIITPNKYNYTIPSTTAIEIVQSKDWKQLDSIILKAKKIISRAGYSTIMDIEFLSCESELTATPGQSEQSYLEEVNKQKP